MKTLLQLITKFTLAMLVGMPHGTFFSLSLSLFGDATAQSCTHGVMVVTMSEREREISRMLKRYRYFASILGSAWKRRGRSYLSQPVMLLTMKLRSSELDAKIPAGEDNQDNQEQVGDDDRAHNQDKHEHDASEIHCQECRGVQWQAGCWIP